MLAPGRRGVAAVLALCGACAVLLARQRVGGAGAGAGGELLQLGPRAYLPRQVLLAPPEQVPSSARLPEDAGPEDATSPEDALEIASRRIDEAYEELRRRHERLLREEEEFDMDRTGDSLERRAHQERLEAAAKELAEYARLLNSKKESIDARRRQLEIAAGSPYIAYADAVGRAAGQQWVAPPPVENGVQMNINVQHHKRGPVNMNINVDDRNAEDWDDEEDYDDAEAPFSPDETMIRNRLPLNPAVVRADEKQALKGAAGTAKLTAEEKTEGKAMLQHIRNKIDAAVASQGSKKGSKTADAGKAASSRKAQADHRAHRAIMKAGAAVAAHADKAAKVGKSSFAATAPVPVAAAAAHPHADKKRRTALHSGVATRGAHGAAQHSKGKIHISKAQQLVDHLPKSVLKKLQAAENAAGVGAEGPGAGSEITGWGEGAKPAQKVKGGTRRAAKVAAPAAGTALATKARGGSSSKLKPMFDFNFDGFGMKLAGEVQTWQPGAAAWYAYMPPDEVEDPLRRASLEGDGFSAAQASASAPLGLVLASALLVLGLAHRP
jgi:hypothetical protein